MITYTHEIKNICDEVYLKIECDEHGLTIDKDGYRVSLEHKEIDEMLEAIRKYSLMMTIGKANAEAILEPEEIACLLRGEHD